MDQTNGKDTLNDESFDDVISWGSPLSKNSDNITSSPSMPASNTLDFLDEEDFQLTNASTNPSNVERNGMFKKATECKSKPDTIGSIKNIEAVGHSAANDSNNELYSLNTQEAKKSNAIHKGIFDSEDSDGLNVVEDKKEEKIHSKEISESSIKGQTHLASESIVEQEANGGNAKNTNLPQYDMNSLNSDFDFSPSSIENVCRSTINEEIKPNGDGAEIRAVSNTTESFTDEEATSQFAFSDSHERAPKVTDFLSSESDDFSITSNIRRKDNASSAQQEGAMNHTNQTASSENKDFGHIAPIVTENSLEEAALSEAENKVESAPLDQNGVRSDFEDAAIEPESTRGISTQTVHFSNREDLRNNIPVDSNASALKSAVVGLPTISGTVKMVPETSKSQNASRFGPSQSSKPQSIILVKHMGDVIIKYYRTTSKRYSNGSLVDKIGYVAEMYKPVIAGIDDHSFKDRTVIDIANYNIKNIQSDYPKIKDILRLRDEEIFRHDIAFSIHKSDLNVLVSDKKGFFSAPDEVYKWIEDTKSLSQLELNVLRYKMGLDYSFRNTELSPGILKQVILINNPELTKAFILQQPSRIVFLVIFLKLGMVDPKAFEFLYSKNLFYQYILSKIGVNVVKIKEPKNKWNVRNIVDFGISKILNVESPKVQGSPLEKVIGSDKSISASQKGNSLKTESCSKTTAGAENSFAARDKKEMVDEGLVGETIGHTFDVERIKNCADSPEKGGDLSARQPHSSSNAPKMSIFDESDEEDLFMRTRSLDIEEKAPTINENAASPPSSFFESDKGLTNKANTSAISRQSNAPSIPVDIAAENNALASAVNETLNMSTDDVVDKDNAFSIDAEASQQATENDVARSYDDGMVSAPEEAYCLEASDQSQLYKKKFSKSFADIFTLEGHGTVSDTIDVSSYVSDVSEADVPILRADDSETKGSVISNLFGFFKKKGGEPKKAKDDLTQSRSSRPLKAEMQAPEKKERKIIQSSYANMKDSQNVDIPGFRPVKK